MTDEARMPRVWTVHEVAEAVLAERFSKGVPLTDEAMSPMERMWESMKAAATRGRTPVWATL